jgi:hypothetical protein
MFETVSGVGRPGNYELSTPENAGLTVFACDLLKATHYHTVNEGRIPFTEWDILGPLQSDIASIRGFKRGHNRYEDWGTRLGNGVNLIEFKKGGKLFVELSSRTGARKGHRKRYCDLTIADMGEYTEEPTGPTLLDSRNNGQFRLFLLSRESQSWGIWTKYSGLRPGRHVSSSVDLFNQFIRIHDLPLQRKIED